MSADDSYDESTEDEDPFTDQIPENCLSPIIVIEDEFEPGEYKEISEPERELPIQHVFSESVGPKHMPLKDSPPIAYFSLFFNQYLLNMLVLETNRYAIQTANKSQRQTAKQWKHITPIEMKAFIACILNMGVVKKQNVFSYWSTQPSQATPWFPKLFARDRFRDINRFFHLMDNENCFPPDHPEYDPVVRCKPLMDHINVAFRHHYNPHQELTVVESFKGIPRRGTCGGVKCSMICDAKTKYCLAFYTYSGAKLPNVQEDVDTEKPGYKTVMNLLNICNFFNKGYHIIIDQFYMSVPLIRTLYDLGTYATGPIFTNMKYLPKNFFKQIAAGERCYRRSGALLVCAYRNTNEKPLIKIILSTKALARNSKPDDKKPGAEPIPEVLDKYNKFKGGIDSSETLDYLSLEEGRSLKYWKKVAFDIFSKMVHNSYILYKENYRGVDKLKTRLEFIIDIIENLSADWIVHKNEPKQVTNEKINSDLYTLDKRKERRCCECTLKNLTRRSRTACNRCKKGVHALCFPEHKCDVIRF